MGRFAWGQGHSKQSSDHKNLLMQEWFSRSTLEPSRHALTELMKEYGSNKSDGSETSHGRSRTNTVTSARSFYARSSSEHSAVAHSRPSSRQSVVHDARYSPTDGQESPGRSLLSKGSRLLKRQGSKLNLLSAQLHDLVPDGQDSTISGPAGSPFSPKRNDLNRTISRPFDFQHVTHTDQGHFQDLNKATGTELVSEFSALQANQQPVGEIQGIPVDDLPSARSSPEPCYRERIPARRSSIQHELPETPPRPQPPPKDALGSPFTPADVRLSRSMENFSRPTRSPAFGVESSHTVSTFDEYFCSISLLSPIAGLGTGPPSPSGWAHSTVDSLSSVSASPRSSTAVANNPTKPLPLLPTAVPAVHAVSTNDDSALLMRAAPLPHLPQHLADVPEEEDEVTAKADLTTPGSKTSRRSSLRHVQSFPSSKASKRRSQIIGEGHLPGLDTIPGSPNPSPTRSIQQKKRISIGLKTIAIDGWEDAIDYSWDHPADLEEDLEFEESDRDPSTPLDVLPQDMYLVVHQPQLELSSSSSSTPLMMQNLSTGKAAEDPLPSPTVGLGMQHLHQIDSSMQGLGIQSLRPATNMEYKDYIHQSSLPTQHPPRRGSLISDSRREPGTPMSKSSSQESIILSIASSIMGTHRSSNSSTSFGDFAHLANFEETMAKTSGLSSTETSGSNSSEGNASDTSQETVKTEHKSPTTALQEPSKPSVQEEFPPPPTKLRRRSSVPRMPVPNRSSSITAGTGPPPAPKTRDRSSTTNSRPRHSPRASYSLFPAA